MSAAPMQPSRVLWRHARLATLAGDSGWGDIARGAVLAEDGRITWVGDETALPAGIHPDAEHDLGGALLSPALVDCHTHLVYAGHRADEFERRLQGASYEAIARAGGGIRRTVAATRAASDATLLALAVQRARTLAAHGVATLEIKSGYGLSLAHEARCLRTARAVGAATGQTVRTTCLAAHTLPPEFEGRADDYIDAVVQWLPQLADQGLVDAVDAFCEHIAFSPAQTQRVFAAAQALGLPVKLHAEQLSDQGGAALAAGFAALSCDHLEWLSDAGIAAMAQAGTVAVLLPGAFHFLRETRLPPVAALRAAGVPLAVATDHNPGSSPTLSLPLMLHLACTLFRLTPEEALRGATVHAARALGLADRGRIAPGQRADLAAWPLDHARELAYGFGHLRCCRLFIGAQPFES
jgi:imidazolonepropionase